MSSRLANRVNQEGEDRTNQIGKRFNCESKKKIVGQRTTEKRRKDDPSSQEVTIESVLI
jgi:hypothetical protein